MINKVINQFKLGYRYFFINLLMALGINKIHLLKLGFPIYLRPRSSDLLTFHQIFTFKEYDVNFGFIPRFIIDAGANIGLASVFFTNKFPEVKIVAIEPENSNFQMLQKNTKDYKNILLNKRALSNQSNLIFDVVDKGFGNWGFVTEIHDLNVIHKIVDTVRSITIDEILIEHNLEYLDLLKIDIEGGEKELFESNYENWLPRTKCIIIELHDGITKGSSKSFFNAISKYDFSYFNRGENLLLINNSISRDL
ncbi:FkbM family methyltransferase [Flavobacterium yafengii]|uniref:FkbM family methyltransferase n=1 Tax=Flavobacterium yafengii TaxID=3041253 RepID=A0AAW6TMH1_9FLAO|nr:FkbM family methyltransferase [Flavobacterium yafengii]MDI5950674.1 FkbM family methyltransferase [Flavobacterium yafengii]